MIKQLKAILNSYTDKELENIDIWVNGEEQANTIIIDDRSINLITDSTEIKINGFIEKEGKNNGNYE